MYCDNLVMCICSTTYLFLYKNRYTFFPWNLIRLINSRMPMIQQTLSSISGINFLPNKATKYIVRYCVILFWLKKLLDVDSSHTCGIFCQNRNIIFPALIRTWYFQYIRSLFSQTGWWSKKWVAVILICAKYIGFFSNIYNLDMMFQMLC